MIECTLIYHQLRPLPVELHDSVLAGAAAVEAVGAARRTLALDAAAKGDIDVVEGSDVSAD